MAVSNIYSNSDYTDALKILQEGKIVEWLHNEESFFKLITSKFSKAPLKGKKIIMPTKDILGHAAVKPIAYNGNFGTRQKVGYDNIEIEPKYITAHLEIERTENELAKAEGGFLDLWNDEMNSKNQAMSEQLSRTIFGRGDGVIGVVSSVVDNGSTGTITLRQNASDQGCAYWFEYGDILKILDASNSYAQLTDLDGGTDQRCIVTDVDYENNTVTVQPCDSSYTVGAWAPGTALAAGDLLVRDGVTYTASYTVLDTASEEMVGLEGIIDDDTTQTLWGIDRSAVPLFKGNKRDLAGELLTVSHLMDMAKRLRARKAKPKILIVSFDTQLRLAEIGLAMRSISEPKIDPVLGVEMPRLVVPHGGTIPIYASRYCPNNKAYFLDTDYFQIRGREPEFVDDDGRIIRLQTSSSGGYVNSITAELWGYLAVTCNAPIKQGKLVNFVNVE